MKYVVLFLFLFGFTQLQGSCGLENCKNPGIYKKKKNIFALEMGAHYTDFTFRDQDGYYEELDLRMSFISKYDWMLDLKLPYISFHYDDKETSGFSNPVIGFEKWFANEHFSPLLGLQLELPLGEESKGIAPDHYELLPYIGLGFTSGAYSLRLVTGYRLSVGGEEHSTSTTVSAKKYHTGHIDPDAALTLADLGPQVVNFHAEEEVQIFLSGGRNFFNDHLFVGLQSTFRQATAGEDKVQLIYGGPSLQYTNGFFKIQSQFSVPLSSDKKMNWNLGLNLTLDF